MLPYIKDECDGAGSPGHFTPPTDDVFEFKVQITSKECEVMVIKKSLNVDLKQLPKDLNLTIRRESEAGMLVSGAVTEANSNPVENNEPKPSWMLNIGEQELKSTLIVDTNMDDSHVYYIFKFRSDGIVEATPVSEWHSFQLTED